MYEVLTYFDAEPYSAWCQVITFYPPFVKDGGLHLRVIFLDDSCLADIRCYPQEVAGMCDDCKSV